MLFGASAKMLSEFTNINIDIIKELMVVLVNEFNIKVISDKIEKQSKACGYFMNFFGRPIYTKDVRMSVLVQNYIQSSAIDICHSGYCNLVSFFEENNMKSRALYTKHDAIIIDVHPSEIQHINDFAKLIGKTRIKGIDFKINTKEVA